MIAMIRSPRFTYAMLSLVYVSGLIGLQTEYRDWFLSFTPANLILSVFLLLCHHRHWKSSFFAFFIITFLVGFGIEVLGVHTGLPFGEYSYGEVLGLKVAEVPLVIGLNWVMLVYCSGMVAHRINTKPWLRAIIGAALMTALDYLIEPVAIAFDFWTWEATEVPLENYAAWFGAALLLNLLFQYSKFAKANKVAAVLFLWQVLFFGILKFSL